MTNRLLLVLAAPMALLSPIIATTVALSLPLSAEVPLQMMALTSGAGLILGILAAVLAPTSKFEILRGLLYVGVLAAIILIAVDLSFGGYQVLETYAATIAGRVMLLACVAVVLCAALWVVRAKAAIILFVASAAFFSSTVLAVIPFANLPPQTQPGKADQTQAPFIFIIFDEAMGLNGLKHAPGGEALSDRLQSILEKNGFKYYPRAFSRHFVSARSIPNTLNFDYTDDSWGPLLRHYVPDGSLKIKSSLFSAKANEGFDITVYATEHKSLDFCFPVANRCEMLQSFNPLNEYLPDTTNTRAASAKVMLAAFGRSTILYRVISRMVDLSLSTTSAIDAYAFPAWFQKFSDDVGSASSGQAYFAHFLFPHSPYVYGTNCVLGSTATIGYFLTKSRKLTQADFLRERERIYRDYLSQYGCLADIIDEFLGQLSDNPVFADATIVMLGDHGARISAGQYAESLSERDMIDNYSALFAIRSPGIPAGKDDRKASIQRLVAEYFSGKPAQELDPETISVVIDSEGPGSKAVLRDMPDF